MALALHSPLATPLQRFPDFNRRRAIRAGVAPRRSLPAGYGNLERGRLNFCLNLRLVVHWQTARVNRNVEQSKYHLAKAYVRWTREATASKLTPEEIDQWKSLIGAINASLK